jgi:triosephosphate isomerase (TIM)
MAGNWKLQPATLSEATNLLKLLHANFVNHRTSSNNNSEDNDIETPEVIVFPPTPFLQEAIRVLQGSGIKVGAQNVDVETTGAYTGQVAASMIRSLGCDYVLIGHSERRTLYDESDENVNAKIKLCLQQPGLNVILCIGETLDEYESQLLSSVVDVQIKKGLKDVSVQDVLDQRLVIAYEPVWAIGTGKVATQQEAQAAHVAVRRSMADIYGHGVADTVRIQYGGSVKPDNVESLLGMPDVDGALVGGASLTADSFTRIVDGAASATANSFSMPCRRLPHEFTAREAVPTKNVLGESAVWSTRDQALYWIDAPLGEVWTWDMVRPAYRRIVGTTTTLGCVAIKQSEVPGSIVLAGENAFLEMTMSAPSSTDFATTGLCPRPEQTDVTRPNDGRVDRQGRFVFGMYNNYHRSPVGECNTCGIYRLNDRCEIESILPKDEADLRYRVSNCISFSPNGDSMYFCDTPTRKIYAFDYGANGLTNRRLVWTMPSLLNGGPDGAQVGTFLLLFVCFSTTDEGRLTSHTTLLFA